MKITVTCPICGHRWTVSRDELLAGGWGVCPQCEGGDDAKGDDSDGPAQPDA